MKIKNFPFEKYQGTGNDFIILDFFEFEFLDLHQQKFIERMCDRRFGIGADGLIAVCKEVGYDFRMKYLNSDGRFSTFCGNGSRCASAYVSRKLGLDTLNFIAADGPHTAWIKKDYVSVKMQDIRAFDQTNLGPLIQSGSPHLIREVEDLTAVDVFNEGKKLRHEFSPEGANVNFVNNKNGVINIATYERGVEDKTLSCGTGITASAYYFAAKSGVQGDIAQTIHAEGGILSVSMHLDGKVATDVVLSGPAEWVYSGFYPIDMES
ncbi:MAG: diaminopimelate epimerase [Saprospiraceae bacterium]|nr:diaminopimelate epimerase [Candidatus Vicinibacter affinis]MBK7798950.1 diaminopimelate epimerase [Candidatus Vicinibacter affinis]